MILFYEKIHKVRSVFIDKVANPKEYLTKDYNIKLLLRLNDNLVHNSRQVMQKIESVDKKTFGYEEKTDHKNAIRIYFGEMVGDKK